MKLKNLFLISTDDHTDFEPKICRTYWELEWNAINFPLICVRARAPPDAKGNGGTSQRSNNNNTYDDSRSKDEIVDKDNYHDRAILKDNPEANCIPSGAKLRSRSRNSNVDVLRNGRILVCGGLERESWNLHTF